MKKWLSELPKNCQVCNKPLGRFFVDGKLAMHSMWAIMCEDCHNTNGAGLGIGKGQKYNTKTKEGVDGFEE